MEKETEQREGERKIRFSVSIDFPQIKGVD